MHTEMLDGFTPTWIASDLPAEPALGDFWDYLRFRGASTEMRRQERVSSKIVWEDIR